MTLHPNHPHRKQATETPPKGGEIIPESGGAIKSESGGEIVGIRSNSSDVAKALSENEMTSDRLYGLFHTLLTIYGMFNDNTPFTTKQLAALVIPETFEVIDWPGIFGVRATPLREALMETFRDPTYSDIKLEF